MRTCRRVGRKERTGLELLQRLHSAYAPTLDAVSYTIRVSSAARAAGARSVGGEEDAAEEAVAPDEHHDGGGGEEDAEGDEREAQLVLGGVER